VIGVGAEYDRAAVSRSSGVSLDAEVLVTGMEVASMI
jgi:hypothetical protein